MIILAVATIGANPEAINLEHEQPAVEEQFVVMTTTGIRLVGMQVPQVEIVFSATQRRGALLGYSSLPFSGFPQDPHPICPGR